MTTDNRKTPGDSQPLPRNGPECNQKFHTVAVMRRSLPEHSLA